MSSSFLCLLCGYPHTFTVEWNLYLTQYFLHDIQDHLMFRILFYWQKSSHLKHCLPLKFNALCWKIYKTYTCSSTIINDEIVLLENFRPTFSFSTFRLLFSFSSSSLICSSASFRLLSSIWFSSIIASIFCSRHFTTWQQPYNTLIFVFYLFFSLFLSFFAFSFEQCILHLFYQTVSCTCSSETKTSNITSTLSKFILISQLHFTYYTIWMI